MEIVILIVLVWYVVAKRNEFNSLRRDIQHQASNIGIYIDKRSACLNDALKIAKVGYEHEIEGVEALTAKDQLDQLAFLGQKYPSLQTTGNYGEIIATAIRLNNDISATRVLVNGNINAYNDAISMFPGLLIAKLFRYKPETLIDEENIAENKKLKKESVDFSQF